MSAGLFETGKYQDNQGNIYRCRVQPETKALVINSVANTYPSGDVDQRGRLRLRKGRREFGVHARFVTLRLPSSSPPAGYAAGGLVTVPLFQSAIFTEAESQTSATYLGVTCEIISATPEFVK